MYLCFRCCFLFLIIRAGVLHVPRPCIPPSWETYFHSHFALSFPATYTFTVRLPLARLAAQPLHSGPTGWLAGDHLHSAAASPRYAHLADVVQTSLDRMVRQSGLRDVYQTVRVIGFSNRTTPATSAATPAPIVSDFYLQLSDNDDEQRLRRLLQQQLLAHNYSVGGTELHTGAELLDGIEVFDFDECRSRRFHDCAAEARCFNLRGTYTCSCREGFADVSGNPVYPGRRCSAGLVGCERCNYHGVCVAADATEAAETEGGMVVEVVRQQPAPVCECFRWYAGSNCYVNLKGECWGAFQGKSSSSGISRETFFCTEEEQN